MPRQNVTHDPAAKCGRDGKHQDPEQIEPLAHGEGSPTQTENEGAEQVENHQPRHVLMYDLDQHVHKRSGVRWHVCASAGQMYFDPGREGFHEAFQELSRALVRDISFLVEEGCSASDVGLRLRHRGNVQKY